ncbi:MAG TPA: HEAT repeat domain-containing protein [Spirochaetota bacterium]|nr:HEAT repeat domain-containing protein [Spirochaetota bacterium]HQP47952.1 HEAT repeat domain-containing protein [Spirochaetota bacterium]
MNGPTMKTPVLIKASLVSIAACIAMIFLISDSHGQQRNSPQSKKSSPAVKQTTAAEAKKSPDKTGAAVPKDHEKKLNAEEKRKQRLEENEKKMTEWIERTLEYGIQKERLEAMNHIMKVRDEERKKNLGKLLITIIKDEIDIEVKSKAIYIAGEIKLKSAIPEISSSLNDDTEDVQIAAVYALKKIRDLSITDKMVEIMKKQDMAKDSNFTGALLDALGEFKASALKDFSLKAIKDNKTTKINREQLIIFLGKAGIKDSKEFLLKLFQDEEEDTTIRSYAVNSLAHLEAKEAGVIIDKEMRKIEKYPFKKQRNYHRLYLYGVAALARLGDERAYPRLVNSARSNNPSVRLQAVRLLKEIKGKRTIDILKYKMKYDPSPRVQSEAKKALKELGVELDEDRNIQETKKLDKKTEKK